MNSRKFLAIILTLCLLFSLMSPAASAVSVRSSEAAQGSGETVSSSKLNDLLVSAADKLGIKLKRDEDKLSYSNGQWLITSADGTMSVAKNEQLPACVQRIREMEQYYAKTDLVAAFVVLESAPTAEKYSAISEVPESKTEDLTAQQDELIEQIKTDVQPGEYLNVIAQFTHLTNSVVIETAFENLEAIAAMDGVKSVFISPVFTPCAASTNLSPYTTSSGQMTGVSNVWHEMGYTGKGMTIAILDTGLDLDHPSFAAAPEGAAWSKDYVQEMLDKYDLNAESLYKGTLTADNVYSHEKVPFIFNYAMGTTNVLHSDGLGDHGTHVAGIAAANNVEGTGVVGMAPDAQIIAMKVFNSTTGGANMYDLVAALEDCMTMGVDVVNMSLGSAAGFASANDEEIDEIFRRISESDIIVDVAAGNDGHAMYGSLYGNSKNTTEYIDNATIASPSTYLNSMAIASASNSYVYGAYFQLADGSNIHYMTPIEVLYEYVDWSLEILAGQELEYVVLEGLGDYDDFFDADENSLVEGKVVIIRRGEISFAEKTLNAQDAGALAVLIWDNVEEDIFNFGMTMTYTDAETGEEIYPDIPAVLISLADGQTMADAEDKHMTAKTDLAPRKDSAGGQMSSFSGWGASPELRLIPELTGIGGNVYSCYDGGEYGLMSGTSMATPQVAGVTAVVLQYLKETNPEATDADIRAMVEGLMMSTAVPIIDDDTGLEASPRQQGAGLVNAYNAIVANAFLSVGSSTRSKVEMGDNEEGHFTFTVTVNNLSNAEKTYRLYASLLCEDFVTSDSYPGKYFIAGAEHNLDESAVSFSADTVTVPAGDSVDVTVTIQLTEEDKLWIDTYFPAGNYVEGYVYFKPVDEADVELSIPFLGFYQDWQEPPVFDTGYWWDNGFWGEESDEVEANQYYHSFFTSLGASTTDWVLGINPYGDLPKDEDGNIIYSDKNNVISPNGDGVMDQITDYYLSLMRNVKWLRLTYTDLDGNVLDCEILDYVSKTMYNSAYGSTVPFVYSWYYDGLYDFTDADGNYLPDGTELILTISAVLAYDDDTQGELDKAESDDFIQIPIHIDTVAPTLVGTPVESTKDDHNYMTLTIKDAHPAAAVLMNTTGTMTYDRYTDMDMEDNGDGTYTLTVDITGLGDNFVVALCDYGGNENYLQLTWSETGTNNPEVDRDALYAYRIYDLYVGFYQGYDYMYGWGIMDKTTGEYTEQRSDAYEYYAITAAEYVDGWVFAVDAGYNLVRMQPGLWNREQICNLGVNVLDMAFDDVNGKMYLITKTTDDYDDTICALYTVDLLTGELALVREYDSEYDMPWAMTFVGDKLYAIRKFYQGIYTVDTATGDMTQVTDSNGENVSFKYFSGSYEASASAGYAQSMTYSKKDGKIYWAFYPNSNYNNGTLFTIDPTDWSYTSTGAYEWSQEYVGLLTLEETSYKLPTSEKITKIALDKQSAVLVPDRTVTLTATMLPWNAPVTEDLVWTSTDETVATVENGVITAVAPGKAEITASYGDVEATCQVLVVDVNGTLYGYNSYSDTGSYYNWFGMDMESMITEDLGISDVDLVAGDYNGHNGCYYAFDATGQCYRYNTSDGTWQTLGTASNVLVADMAYDYSSGYMYAIVYDESSWSTTIYRVNLYTGALVEYAYVYENVFLTLACDMGGNLFAIDTYGSLYMVEVVEDPDSGIGGWDPWLSINEEMSAADRGVDLLPMLETGYQLAYQQSMCYDHNNDTIIWSCPDQSTVYWIDLYTTDEAMLIDLGRAPGVTSFQYFGTFVYPAYIPELEDVYVDNIEAENMALLVGASRLPNVTIEPLNATNQNVVYTSADESVARIENGMIVGVGVGVTTITGTLQDFDETYSFEFEVSVKGYSDKVFAYEMYDSNSGDGNFWMSIDARDPENYEALSYVADDDGNIFLLYSAEYVAGEGVMYAYGYVYDSVDTSWYFLTIDTASWQITSKIQKPNGFATFVYDMAFDYTTGTMFAVAGPNSETSDLYMVNMTNGDVIPCMAIEKKLMGLVVTGDGEVLAMAASEVQLDEWGFQSGAGNAILYRMDVANGEYEAVLDTGVKSNLLAPMAYDHDTGYIYWNACYRADYFSNMETGFYQIDPADGVVCHLGRIGVAGSQITCLTILADEYPQLPEELVDVTVVEDKMELGVGDVINIDMIMHPYFVDGNNAQITWESENEAVATVDESGYVTAQAAGTTNVSVTVSYGGKTITKTVSVTVYSEEQYLITYDRDIMGFVTISRTDPTQSTVLTSGEEVGVTAMEIINGIIYGYDDEGNLFRTDAEAGYARTVIGHNAVEVYEADESATYSFQIRDMAWDAANNRMLVLGVQIGHFDYGYYQYDGAVGGCRIYEADLTTGALTELVGISDPSGEMDYDGRVLTMAVDGEGNVYIMSYWMSCVSKVDLITGATTDLTSFQNQGATASDNGNLMAMAYDKLTNSLYISFSETSSCYELYRYDLATGKLTSIGLMGDVEYGSWYNTTHVFNGLIANEKHVCDHVVSGYVAATCTTSGYSGDRYCAECGRTVYGQEIPATGHLRLIAMNQKPATCISNGYSGDIYCVDCGAIVRQGNVLPAGEHKNTEVRDAVAATCTTEGYTGDTYCTDCGTKIASGEKIEALGHGETEIRDASEATCTVEGYTGDTYCTVCGEKIASGEKIEALGHGETEIRNAREATCTADGYTGDTYCTVCGEKIASGEKIGALGHKTEVRNASEATCTVEGYTGDTYCTVCGEKVASGEVVAKKAHSYTSTVTEPTTDAAGYTTYTCSVCGDSYVSNFVDKVVAEGGDVSISVEEGSSAVLDENTTLKAEQIKETVSDKAQANIQIVSGDGAEVLASYDISLFREGAKVQPGGKVAVTLPAPANASEFASLQVVYIDDDGNVTPCETRVNGDGTITFITDHFSHYAIIGIPHSTSSSLIWICVAAVVVIAGAAAAFVVLKKKKATR